MNIKQKTSTNNNIKKQHLCLMLITVVICSTTAQAQSTKETLPPVHTIEVPEIVITGTRTEQNIDETPVKVDVITEQQISTSGAKNLADVLETTPGITIDRDQRGIAVTMQGLDSRYVLILVDGQRLTGRSGGNLDLTAIDTQSIDRIEIVHGAASALYGSDAIGGVINILTKQPKKTKLHVGSRYGSRNTAKFEAASEFTAATIATRFSADWTRSDGYDLLLTTPATTGSAYNTLNVRNTTHWVKTKHTEFSSMIDYHFDQRKGIDQSSGNAIFDRVERTDQVRSQISSQWSFSGKHQLSITPYYAYFKNSYLLNQRNSNELDSIDITKEQIGQMTIQYNKLWLRNIFSAGTELLIEDIDSTRVPNAQTRFRTALFVQDEWTILDAPRLSLLPGLRIDIDSQFGQAYSPKLLIRVDPHRLVSLRASYGRGFRAPDFKQLYLIFENPSAGYILVGNKNLAAEQSHNLNVSLDYQPATKLSISLNSYFNTIKNLIEATGVDSDQDLLQFRYTNIAKATTAGFEINIKATAAPGLTLQGGYHFLIAKDQENNRMLEKRSHHQANIRIDYQVGLWTLTLRSTWNSKKPLYLDQQNQQTTYWLKPTLLAHAAIAYTPISWLNIYLGVDNIAGVGDHTYSAIEPRTFYGGFAIDLNPPLNTNKKGKKA